MSCKASSYYSFSINNQNTIYIFNIFHQLNIRLNNLSFGQRLKIERNRIGISQNKLSELTKLNSSTIVDYEMDHAHPSKENLLKLGVVLDLGYLCIEGYSKLIMTDFSTKLKNWRICNSLSIKDASILFSVHIDTYRRWESKIYNISINNYVKNKKLIESILE